jgi:calcineurin-like phosphoesterase family protein
MSNVFYTSDLHIGHRLVAGLRGFWKDTSVPLDEREPDVEAHDAWIAQNWQQVVKPGDQVFVLGDISINGGQHALDWMDSVNGTKHLISGNHDPVHPQNRKSIKVMRHWLDSFETIQPFLRRKLEGKTVLLSHFPYESWGEGPNRPGVSRMNQYRLPEMGDLLLHGHTHTQEVAHGKQYHVGLDAHDLQLVPQDTILEWVRTFA